LAAPFLIDPIRSFDVCPYDDGGAAVIITSTDRAKHFRNRPVSILGITQTTELRGLQNRDNIDRAWMKKVADGVFSVADVSRADIDLVSIQDPGSPWVVQMLEHFGFVGPGEGGPFIAEGHTAPGGKLPVNTSGGHLAESYMWGWLHIVEIVRQLRGHCGQRQVPGARLAIHCSTRLNLKGAATICGVTE
jgi:acetyl-CoA acetyltransferase